MICGEALGCSTQEKLGSESMEKRSWLAHLLYVAHFQYKRNCGYV